MRSKIDNKRFIEMWNSGMLCRDIAKEFDTTIQVVIKYASRHRNECPSRKGKIDHHVFVNLWKCNTSLRDIAEYFKVSVSQVYQYAANHRDVCPIRKPRGKTNSFDNKVELEEFAGLWNSGASILDIAKHFEISKRYVYGYAWRHKTYCIPRKNRINLNKFVKLWNNGAKIQTIAETFGISKKTVYEYAKKHRELCPKRYKREGRYNVKDI